MSCTPVAQIISVYRSDDNIAQLHVVNRPGQVSWFIRIQWVRPTMTHIAKRAAPGTDITHDHESRGALGKTFAEVGTGRLFTNRKQAIFAQACLKLFYAVPGGGLGTNPWWFTFYRPGRHNLNRDAGYLISTLELNSLYYLILFQLSSRSVYRPACDPPAQHFQQPRIRATG